MLEWSWGWKEHGLISGTAFLRVSSSSPILCSPSLFSELDVNSPFSRNLSLTPAPSQLEVSKPSNKSKM